MTLAQAYAWDDALHPDRGERRDEGSRRGGATKIEIRSPADLAAALEAARKGELVI